MPPPFLCAELFLIEHPAKFKTIGSPIEIPPPSEPPPPPSIPAWFKNIWTSVKLIWEESTGPGVPICTPPPGPVDLLLWILPPMKWAPSLPMPWKPPAVKPELLPDMIQSIKTGEDSNTETPPPW